VLCTTGRGVPAVVVRTAAVAEAWGGVAEAWGGASASCAGGVVAAGASHLNYGEGSLV
jgi:hypothetical protein